MSRVLLLTFQLGALCPFLRDFIVVGLAFFFLCGLPLRDTSARRLGWRIVGKVPWN